VRASLGLAVVSMAAVSCGSTDPAVLRVRVLVDPGVAGSCIVLRVNGGAGGETRQVRGAGAVERNFTLERGEQPERVRVTAGAGVGDGCADPLVFSGWTQDVEGAFASPPDPAVVLHLSPPPRSADLDGDGFAAMASTNPDCDDTNPHVHPGAPEVCLDGVDADCNMLVGCADPQCAAAPCAPAATRLAFGSEPQVLATGECSAPVILRAATATGAVAGLARELPLSFQVTPRNELRFFVDAACTVPLTDLNLGPGTLPARLHVKGETGESYVLQVSAPGLLPASQPVVIRPMVMAGTCVMSAFTNHVVCPTPSAFEPAHSMLVFQATTSDDTPSSTDVICSITSRTAVICDRVGYDKDATISWQVLQRPGLTVQHVVRPVNTPGTVTIAPVDRTASTFTLASFAISGGTQGSNDFRYVQLTSPTSVAMTSSEGGDGTVSLQVVEWPGSTVTRGVTPAMEGLTLDVGGLAPVDLSRTFLTYGLRSQSGSDAICNRNVRGELTSPTSIRFSRGDGALACRDVLVEAIGWERVQLPAGVRVQGREVALSAGAGAGTVPIDPVDVTRSFLLAGGQFTSGQAGGEGSYRQGDVLGEMLGALTFATPSLVQVTRAATVGSARWNVFAVEVPP